VAGLSGNALVSINKVNLRLARLVLGWVTVSGFSLGAGHLSWYVTSHPGQLSLAIHSWGGAVQQLAIKIGMVRVWVAGKTV